MAEVQKVEIPASLHKKLEEKIKGTEFGSVSEYVVFVMMELLAAEQEGPGMSREDEEKIKSRLKALGYND
ncbi:MAG: CopG family transcriptional regulator [Candidatus Micrarchaeota archaeon]